MIGKDGAKDLPFYKQQISSAFTYLNLINVSLTL
jgi:hypothetical protein